MTDILTQEPVKWAENWAPIADRESKQLSQHITDWAATGTQEVAKATDESLEKNLRKLAPLVPKAAKTAEFLKKRDLKKQQEIAKAYQINPEWLEHSPNIDKFRKEKYEIEKRNLSKSEEQTLIDALASDLGLNTPAAQDLLNVSGRRLVVQSELLARNKVATFTKQRMETQLLELDQGDNGTRLAEWQAIQGDSNKVESAYMQWQLDELGYLNLNKETIQALLRPELKKRSSTAANLTKASTHTLVSDNVDIQRQEILNTARKTGDLSSAIWDVRADIEASHNFVEYTDDTGKTVTVRQQIDNELFKTLFALTTDNVDGLGVAELSPYLETGFPHPAGKNGEAKPSEVLFSKEQVNLLVNAARKADGRALEIRQAQVDGLYERVINAKAGGQHSIDGVKIEELEQQLLDTGLLTEKQTNKLENIGDTSKETYDAEKDGYWNKVLINGNVLSKENIEAAKTIRSVPLRNEIQGLQNELLKSQRINDFADYESRFKTNGNLIMWHTKDRALGDGESLFGMNKRLQYELTNLEDYWFAQFQKLDPNDTEIADKVLAKKTQWLTDRGFYDIKKRNPQGILSPDQSGNRPNYATFRNKKIISETNIKNENVTAQWNSKFWSSWNEVNPETPGETTIEKLLNTPDTVLSAAEIEHDLQFGMSGKLIYTAGMIPGKNESEVLLAIAESLKVRGGGTKNLDKLIKNFKERSRSHYRLKNLVDNLNDSDTKTIYNNLVNASPNQLTRFENSLRLHNEIAEENEEIESKRIEKEKSDQLAAGTFKDENVQITFNNKLTAELRSMGYEDEAITELLGQGEALRVVKENQKISAKLKEMGYSEEAIIDLWSQGLAISEYNKYAPKELFNR